MFLTDKPWPSRKNPLYVTGKLRRLEDVIWMRIHRPCALRGHPPVLELCEFQSFIACARKSPKKHPKEGLPVLPFETISRDDHRL